MLFNQTSKSCTQRFVRRTSHQILLYCLLHLMQHTEQLACITTHNQCFYYYGLTDYNGYITSAYNYNTTALNPNPVSF